VWLEGDGTRLEQVICNLLTNAAKYTPAGGRIWLTGAREEGVAVLRVRDTGTGMPPELLARAFDPFTQGTRSSARSEGGLGIGLTLVKRIVELHGGSVTAHSQGPGQGSEFVIRLPLPRQVPPASAEQCEVPVLSRPLRVLVVEDVADAAETLAEMLQLWGHTVATAPDGPGALLLAQEFRPDVVLLDIGLPGMDGYDVAQLLRRSRAADGARLIALTGYGQEQDRERSREAGMDGHLVKPVDPAELQRALALPPAGTGPGPRAECPREENEQPGATAEEEPVEHPHAGAEAP
jgi:CheY-like chemotaxis protein